MNDLLCLEKKADSRSSNIIKHLINRILHGNLYLKEDIDGFLSKMEGAMLYKWASQLKPGSIILEIGTFSGLSTWFLASGARISESIVYSIDPFDTWIDRHYDEFDGSTYKPSEKKSKSKVMGLLTSESLSNYVNLIEGFT